MSQNDNRDNEAVREMARVSLLVSGLSVAACVMGLSLSLAYGATAAKLRVANAAASVTAADFAGRWSGNYHGYGAARANCDGGPCKITLDITPCANSWCGVLVKEDGSCGSAALKVEAGEGKDDWMHFNGRLELEPKAASYAIQATLWNNAKGEKGVDIIGDTGKELVLMRRSFPFSARLSRSGDAVCKSEKATS